MITVSNHTLITISPNLVLVAKEFSNKDQQRNMTDKNYTSVKNDKMNITDETHLSTTQFTPGVVPQIEEDVILKRRRGLITQSLLTAVVAIATAGNGMCTGYSAILLPQLKSNNGSLQIDEDMGSWIASIHFASGPIGSFICAATMEFCGRKISLLLSCVPFIGGWLFVGFSGTYAVLLIGRILTGIAVGITGTVAQIYVAEVAYPTLRGVLTSILTASYTFGIALVYIFGSIADWRIVSGISAIMPTITIVGCYFLPETPVWLVRHGKYEQARKSCLWFRGGNNVETEHEIQVLIDRTEREKLQEANSPRSSWKSFCTPHVLKPLLIINILMLLVALTGAYLLILYAVEIIANAGEGSNISVFFIAVLTAIARFVCIVIACILLKHLNRRTIVIGSAISSGIPMICLALSLYCQKFNNVYFITACLLTFTAGNTLGLMVVPTIMMGEMFPPKARGVASSITVIFLQAIVFGTTKVFPHFENVAGIEMCFLLFAIFSFLTALFIYVMVPETKDKTLNEIEDYFRQDNIMWVTRNRTTEKNINI